MSPVLMLLALAAYDVAITIDDLPLVSGTSTKSTRASVIDRITGVLAKRQVPAMGFVTCDKGTDAEMQRWARAGVPLANHTNTHRSVDALGVEGFLADTVA